MTREPSSGGIGSMLNTARIPLMYIEAARTVGRVS